jgi:hypothetical protein
MNARMLLDHITKRQSRYPNIRASSRCFIPQHCRTPIASALLIIQHRRTLVAHPHRHSCCSSNIPALLLLIRIALSLHVSPMFPPDSSSNNSCGTLHVHQVEELTAFAAATFVMTAIDDEGRLKTNKIGINSEKLVVL